MKNKPLDVTAMSEKVESTPTPTPSTITSTTSTSEENKNAPTELGEYIQNMFKHENDLSKDQALKLCSNHIGGLWKTRNIDDLDLSIIA